MPGLWGDRRYRDHRLNQIHSSLFADVYLIADIRVDHSERRDNLTIMVKKLLTKMSNMEKEIYPKLHPDGLDSSRLDQAEEIDRLPHGGRLIQLDGHLWFVAPEDRGGWVTEYEKDDLATLFYGLWDLTNGYNPPSHNIKQQIPIDVAKHGQEAICAYLRISGGLEWRRDSVSRELDISEQTVSNYCNRVRLDPRE
jgi:hypothetical protein